MKEFTIDTKKIGVEHPTYFIADVGANHDGDLERAKDLIYLCAENGADAVKFQHFSAKTIVSDYGFKSLKGQQAHQSKWKKSVFDVYQQASINIEWTATLKEICEKAGVTFFTSPYSLDLVDAVDPYVPAYKIGSGDITWAGIIEHIAKKNKPVLLASGASTMQEVMAAMNIIQTHTQDIVLMQCNTNYVGEKINLHYINLNVLKTYAIMYPNVILGLSDHTFGHTTVLGAVALGARVIEKHFTDNNDREGPDHHFSMVPSTWKEMVERTRELEYALGSSIKKVEDNEKETVIVQRRAIRAKHRLDKAHVLTENDIEILRPCPIDAISPFYLHEIIGKKISTTIEAGDYLRWSNLS